MNKELELASYIKSRGLVFGGKKPVHKKPGLSAPLLKWLRELGLSSFWVPVVLFKV